MYDDKEDKLQRISARDSQEFDDNEDRMRSTQLGFDSVLKTTTKFDIDKKQNSNW